MPSGGTWVPSDTTNTGQRPGLYANFIAKAAALISGGATGIVAMPVTADWGPLRTVVTIASQSDVNANYSTSTNGTAYFGLTECLRAGCKTIYAYRIAGAAAAKATRILQDNVAATAITLTALYEGARANAFTVDVTTNALNGAAKDLKISESGVVLETWTDTTNAGLVAQINAAQTAAAPGSKYVTAVIGGGTFLTNVAGAAFTGGNSGLVALAADWTGAMAALEPYAFDVFAPQALVDTTIWTSIVSWVTGLRSNGNRIMLVLGSATAETVATAKTNATTYGNYEGIAYVYPGVTDINGVVRTGAEFVSRIAGLIAAHSLDKGLTFEPITNITALGYMATNAEVKSLLTSGVMVLTSDGRGGFRIEKGINTLTTLSATQSAIYKKIRIIRILDTINNSIASATQTSFIGNIENTPAGQSGVIAAIKAFLDTLYSGGYIQTGFTVTLDPANPSTGDKMFVLVGVQPVDTIDYVYLTVAVQT